MIDHRLKKQLAKIGAENKKINKIILFGSRAIGDNIDTSDIDLAFAAPGMTQEEWTSLTFAIEEALDTLLFLDLVKYEEAPDRLKEEINVQGKVLYCKKGYPA